MIGALTSVQSIEQTNISNKLTSRCTLMIQNISTLKNYLFYPYFFLTSFTILFFNFCKSEKLQVTLWGAIAEKFDEEILKSISEPVIITLATMSVKQFFDNLLKSYYQNHAYIYILYN